MCHLSVTSRAVLKGRKKKTLVTPTEMNFHGDALCFMVMGPSLLQKLAVGAWWQLAVDGGWCRLVVDGGWWVAGGGGWQRLAVGGGWRLAVVGGWRLVVPGGCP